MHKLRKINKVAHTIYLLKVIGISLVCLAVSACGFHVRTAELDSLGFDALKLRCDESASWEFCQELKRELRAHKVNILDSARYELSIASIEAKERVFTINSDATADEYELRRTAKFALSDQTNTSAEYKNEVSARRIYRHNSDALLAKEREQETISRTLDHSLAKEIIRQLTLIRIGQP